MKKVRIHREKWRCGSDNSESMVGLGPTRLLNDEGYMCCLGFVCNQLGRIPKRDLWDINTPSNTGRNFRLLVSTDSTTGVPYDNALTVRAIETNDNPLLDQRFREGQLSKLFKKYDVELEFVGEYGHGWDTGD